MASAIDKQGVSMRIPVTIVVDMTDAQVEAYADEYGLPRNDAGKVMARTIAQDVRSYVLTTVQESAAFGEIGDGNGTRAADVSIKR
jgi:hypothetical protein